MEMSNVLKDPCHAHLNRIHQIVCIDTPDQLRRSMCLVFSGYFVNAPSDTIQLDRGYSDQAPERYNILNSV